MIERFSQGALTWVNLKSPSSDEVHVVMNEYAIPPELIGDLTATVPRNYATSAQDAIKLVMDFPVVKRTDVAHQYEIKFIVGKHYFISIQYTEMEAIDQFKKQFEVLSTLHKTSKRALGGHLFTTLLAELYDSAGTKLDYIESIITSIESEIFNDNERQMVIAIAEVSRNLIAFRHVLQVHNDVFTTALPLFNEQYKHVFKNELEEIHTHYSILMRRSNSLFESISALHNANSAMLNTKQNEVMKMLTIMAFITFPLSLFTSLFSMGAVSTPIMGERGDFWIILGMVIFAAASFLAFFRYKHWM